MWWFFIPILFLARFESESPSDGSSSSQSEIKGPSRSLRVSQPQNHMSAFLIDWLMTHSLTITISVVVVVVFTVRHFGERELGVSFMFGGMWQRLVPAAPVMFAPLVPRLPSAVPAHRDLRVACQHQLPRVLGTDASQWYVEIMSTCPTSLQTKETSESWNRKTNVKFFLLSPVLLQSIHLTDIRTILNNESLLEKYEDFMLRRVLAVDPDSRWCPAPDCNFAVLASGCASCPRLLCQRPGCGSSFCYHCKVRCVAFVLCYFNFSN